MTEQTPRTQLQNKVQNLESGDYIDYNKLCQLVDETENAEQRNIYCDSVGFLESVELDGYQIMVVDSLNGDPMVRQTCEDTADVMVE